MSVDNSSIAFELEESTAGSSSPVPSTLNRIPLTTSMSGPVKAGPQAHLKQQLQRRATEATALPRNVETQQAPPARVNRSVTSTQRSTSSLNIVEMDEEEEDIEGTEQDSPPGDLCVGPASPKLEPHTALRFLHALRQVNAEREGSRLATSDDEGDTPDRRDVVRAQVPAALTAKLVQAAAARAGVEPPPHQVTTVERHRAPPSTRRSVTSDTSSIQFLQDTTTEDEDGKAATALSAAATTPSNLQATTSLQKKRPPPLVNTNVADNVALPVEASGKASGSPGGSAAVTSHTRRPHSVAMRAGVAPPDAANVRVQLNLSEASTARGREDKSEEESAARFMPPQPSGAFAPASNADETQESHPQRGALPAWKMKESRPREGSTRDAGAAVTPGRVASAGPSVGGQPSASPLPAVRSGSFPAPGTSDSTGGGSPLSRPTGQHDRVLSVSAGLGFADITVSEMTLPKPRGVPSALASHGQPSSPSAAAVSSSPGQGQPLPGTYNSHRGMPRPHQQTHSTDFTASESMLDNDASGTPVASILAPDTTTPNAKTVPPPPMVQKPSPQSSPGPQRGMPGPAGQATAVGPARMAFGKKGLVKVMSGPPPPNAKKVPPPAGMGPAVARVPQGKTDEPKATEGQTAVARGSASGVVAQEASAPRTTATPTTKREASKPTIAGTQPSRDADGAAAGGVGDGGTKRRRSFMSSLMDALGGGSGRGRSNSSSTAPASDEDSTRRTGDGTSHKTSRKHKRKSRKHRTKDLDESGHKHGSDGAESSSNNVSRSLSRLFSSLRKLSAGSADGHQVRRSSEKSSETGQSVRNDAATSKPKQESEAAPPPVIPREVVSTAAAPAATPPYQFVIEDNFLYTDGMSNHGPGDGRSDCGSAASWGHSQHRNSRGDSLVDGGGKLTRTGQRSSSRNLDFVGEVDDQDLDVPPALPPAPKVPSLQSRNKRRGRDHAVPFLDTRHEKESFREASELDVRHSASRKTGSDSAHRYRRTDVSEDGVEFSFEVDTGDEENMHANAGDAPMDLYRSDANNGSEFSAPSTPLRRNTTLAAPRVSEEAHTDGDAAAAATSGTVRDSVVFEDETTHHNETAVRTEQQVGGGKQTGKQDDPDTRRQLTYGGRGDPPAQPRAASAGNGRTQAAERARPTRRKPVTSTSGHTRRKNSTQHHRYAAYESASITDDVAEEDRFSDTTFRDKGRRYGMYTQLCQGVPGLSRATSVPADAKAYLRRQQAENTFAVHRQKMKQTWEKQRALREASRVRAEKNNFSRRQGPSSSSLSRAASQQRHGRSLTPAGDHADRKGTLVAREGLPQLTRRERILARQLVKLDAALKQRAATVNTSPRHRPVLPAVLERGESAPNARPPQPYPRVLKPKAHPTTPPKAVKASAQKESTVAHTGKPNSAPGSYAQGIARPSSRTVEAPADITDGYAASVPLLTNTEDPLTKEEHQILLQYLSLLVAKHLASGGDGTTAEATPDEDDPNARDSQGTLPAPLGPKVEELMTEMRNAFLERIRQQEQQQAQATQMDSPEATVKEATNNGKEDMVNRSQSDSTSPSSTHSHSSELTGTQSEEEVAMRMMLRMTDQLLAAKRATAKRSASKTGKPTWSPSPTSLRHSHDKARPTPAKHSAAGKPSGTHTSSHFFSPSPASASGPTRDVARAGLYDWPSPEARQLFLLSQARDASEEQTLQRLDAEDLTADEGVGRDSVDFTTLHGYSLRRKPPVPPIQGLQQTSGEPSAHAAQPFVSNQHLTRPDKGPSRRRSSVTPPSASVLAYINEKNSEQGWEEDFIAHVVPPGAPFVVEEDDRPGSARSPSERKTATDGLANGTSPKERVLQRLSETTSGNPNDSSHNSPGEAEIHDGDSASEPTELQAGGLHANPDADMEESTSTVGDKDETEERRSQSPAAPEEEGRSDHDDPSPAPVIKVTDVSRATPVLITQAPSEEPQSTTDTPAEFHKRSPSTASTEHSSKTTSPSHSCSSVNDGNAPEVGSEYDEDDEDDASEVEFHFSESESEENVQEDDGPEDSDAEQTISNHASGNDDDDSALPSGADTQPTSLSAPPVVAEADTQEAEEEEEEEEREVAPQEEPLSNTEEESKTAAADGSTGCAKTEGSASVPQHTADANDHEISRRDNATPPSTAGSSRMPSPIAEKSADLSDPAEAHLQQPQHNSTPAAASPVKGILKSSGTALPDASGSDDSHDSHEELTRGDEMPPVATASPDENASSVDSPSPDTGGKDDAENAPPPTDGAGTQADAPVEPGEQPDAQPLPRSRSGSTSGRRVHWTAEPPQEITIPHRSDVHESGGDDGEDTETQRQEDGDSSGAAAEDVEAAYVAKDAIVHDEDADEDEQFEVKTPPHPPRAQAATPVKANASVDEETNESTASTDVGDAPVAVPAAAAPLANPSPPEETRDHGSPPQLDITLPATNDEDTKETDADDAGNRVCAMDAQALLEALNGLDAILLQRFPRYFERAAGDAPGASTPAYVSDLVVRRPEYATPQFPRRTSLPATATAARRSSSPSSSFYSEAMQKYGLSHLAPIHGDSVGREGYPFHPHGDNDPTTATGSRRGSHTDATASRRSSSQLREFAFTGPRSQRWLEEPASDGLGWRPAAMPPLHLERPESSSAARRRSYH